MDARRLSSYPSSVLPDDEQFMGMICPRSPPPDAIELTNIPFISTNFYYNYPNEDDDDLSLYLGAENISNCPNPTNLISSHQDMACVSCKDCANIVIDPMVQNHFPVMLHRLLSDATHQDSCMWLPHGRAFVITNNKAHFCANVIPLIFHNTISYEVFIDSIEKYGFHQVQVDDGHGVKSSAFYHKRFLNFRWWLASTMEPRRDDAMFPTIPRSAAQSQHVFDCLQLLPTLKYEAHLSSYPVVLPHASTVPSYQLPIGSCSTSATQIDVLAPWQRQQQRQDQRGANVTPTVTIPPSKLEKLSRRASFLFLPGLQDAANAKLSRECSFPSAVSLKRSLESMTSLGDGSITLALR